MKFLLIMSVTTWVVMVTKQIINTWVILGTNQINSIIKMVVTTWVVMVTKQTITTWVVLRIKKFINQIIKIATSITIYVMHGIGVVIVVTGETLVKIVATCIIYNNGQEMANYHKLQCTSAVSGMNHAHIDLSFSGFQCTAATPQIIYPHSNISFSELYLMVPLFR